MRMGVKCDLKDSGCGEIVGAWMSLSEIGENLEVDGLRPASNTNLRLQWSQAQQHWTDEEWLEVILIPAEAADSWHQQNESMDSACVCHQSRLVLVV